MHYVLPKFRSALIMCSVLTLISGILCAQEISAKLDESRQKGNESFIQGQEYGKMKSLVDVLNELEKKFKVSFAYESEVIEDLKMDISRMDLSNKSLAENLKELPPTLVYHKVSNSVYAIYKKDNGNRKKKSHKIGKVLNTHIISDALKIPDRLANLVSDHEQEIRVSGTVTSGDDGSVLPGVNVIEKGTTNGTTTDADGVFSLSVQDENSVLIFSFIGYTPQEVLVGSQTEFSINLQPDIKALEEIVVVGYGTSRKVDVTGALTRVDISDDYMKPNVNVVQSLKGSIAGVRVTDGLHPGADGTILIRGHTSITASNAPLLVLDGIPYNGNLSDINTNDIESIDVLKDASSAAIYGSRATNGVILITTKRGKSAKPTLNFNGYFGFSDFARTPKLMGPEKYLQLKKDAAEFLGQSEPLLLHPLEEANLEKGIYTDPWEVVSQDAPVMSYDLSMSGKTDRINYYVSGSYTDMKSIVYGDNFNRLSVRINLDVNITDWLNIGTNTGYSVKDYSGIPANLVAASYQSPYGEYFYEDGVPRYYTYGEGLAPNPLFNSLQNENKDISSILFSNVYAEIFLPLPGLTYRVNVANNLRRVDNFNYAPALDRDIVRSGSGNQTHNKNYNFTLNHILKYNQTFKDIHSVDVTLVHEIESILTENIEASNNNIFNDALSYYGLGLGENPNIITSAVDQKAVASMARIGYRFHDRYLANFTIRRDGFSAFGEDHKFGTFPSIGVGWVLSEENFLSHAKWIQLLKLRYSYGKNGNRGISPYSSLSSIDHSGYEYVFGDGSATFVGIIPTSMANPTLGWESTVASNFGVDFNLFENRISGAVEYYIMDTKDLLLNLSIPNMTGFERYLTNIGATHNYGVEVTLNAQPLKKGNFNWFTDIVYSLNRNKVIRLGGVDIDGDGKEDDDIASRRFIGHSLFSWYDYVADGVWQEGDDFSLDPAAKPGYLKFKDISGPDGVPDGKIGPEDRKVIGTSQPDFLLGLTNTIAWKNLSFSIAFDGRFGGKSADSFLSAGNNFYYRTNILDLPYWTKDNPGNEYPSVGYPNPYGYNFYESRTFVRLQDASLMYDLPESLISKVKINSAKVYISGKNLATWTKWKNWDPESGTGGRNNDGVVLKSWVAGVNISL